MSRFNGLRTLGPACFLVAGLAALALAPSVWLDLRGAVAVARVVGKREDLLLERSGQGEWRRRWWLAVRFTDVEQREHGANVKVDRGTFDQARLGSVIQVRHLPCCPFFARSTQRSTSTMLAEFIASTFSWWMLWLPLVFLALVYGARASTLSVVLAAPIWLVSIYVLFFTDRTVVLPIANERAALARVGRVELVQESTEPDDSRALPVPYQLVEFSFLPQGARDTVRGADAVDAGSVAGLVDGSRALVHYEAAEPRHASLAGGTRTFSRRNLVLHWVDVFFLGALPALFAVAWRLSTTRQRRRMSLTDAQVAAS